MNNIKIPYVQISSVKYFMRNFPKESICFINELADIFGKSKLYNILPTVELLELIDYNKSEKSLKLTDLGKKFRTAIITKNEKEAAKFIKPIVEKKEPFLFIKGLLERKKFLSSDDIGKELSFKYGKTWNNPATFRAYGSACANILSFVGFGVFIRGFLRKEGTLVRETEKPVLPSCTFNFLWKITKKIADLKEVNLKVLIKEYGKRVQSGISVGVELGLMERPAPGIVKITERGNNLVFPFNQNKIPEIWSNILIESNYAELITLLKDEEFSALQVGEFLNRHIGGRWASTTTIKDYGKKFLNWLRKAEFVEKIGQGKYKFSKQINIQQRNSFGSMLEKKNEEEISNKRIFSLIDYNLGKNIGIINSASSENYEQIKNAFKELIEICNQKEFSQELLNLLREHYKLFLELKDKRIILPDIKLLEKKLGIKK